MKTTKWRKNMHEESITNEGQKHKEGHKYKRVKASADITTYQKVENNFREENRKDLISI
jgi:hypothetical protein